MLITLLTIVHLFVCFFLILVVLLQTGKGVDVAATLGGTSSQTAFGARGAATLLSKLTTASAIVFMLTSFTLALLANTSGSVVTDEPVQQQSAPAAPVPAPSEPAPQTPPPAPQN
ncbi:MAG TPA: preprotein translocase subunit SecG [Candidatus Polarisedimenticolia bacterium]|nr:preprotein translocase subunit SecG [Candidatus Polarisedimenticolia bacterium]